MSEPVLALAASPRDWAQRLHRHVTDHGGALVRCTVLDPHGCLAEPYDVLVVDDTTSFLSRNLVGQLRAQGRRVLGVYDPDDPRGKQDLLDIGVDDVIERGVEADELVRAVGALVGTDALRDADLGGVGGVAGTDRAAPGGPGADAAGQDRGGDRGDRGRGADRSAVHVAVAGAGGGVGASEVALALSGVAGARGRRAVLVDADDAGPSLAQRLGAAPYPNLRSAVDAVEHGAGDLARILQPVQPGVALLPGLASAQDWAHLRPVEVTAVVKRLRPMADAVITDVGDGVEDLSAWGGPARHGVSRALLRAADQVVVVAGSNPVGLARLLAWCAEARALLQEGALTVVLNRAPRSAFSRRQLLEEVQAGAGPVPCTLLPTDMRLEQAAWAGQALTSGPFAHGAELLAQQLLALPSRRRKWRRPALRAAS